MSLIAVVDYGMGNLRSVAKALEHVAPQHDIEITGDPQRVDAASRVVFPGQGAMPDCMSHLAESGLTDALLRAASTRPLLGICVGEHMLLDESDESATDAPTPGLGLIAGRVERFGEHFDTDGFRLKVPHMGWNRVQQLKSHPLWDGIDDGSWFYFVHSFYAVPDRADDAAAQTEYGTRFTCALARDNIFATQFHPEKSASRGLRMYENFVRWNP